MPDRVARSPLAGRGVAITHSEIAPGRLERRLAALGATVHRWSAVETRPPSDPEPLEAALEDLSCYDWIVFASSHAAESVAERCPPPSLRPRVAAVGRATASSLLSLAWPVDRLPTRFSAAGLLSEFTAAGDAPGARILLPESSLARDELSRGLLDLGAEVERVVAYEAVPRVLDGEACLAALRGGAIDAVTFASPSAVAALGEVCGEELFGSEMGRLAIVAIGPTTARALSDFGRPPDAIAGPHTFDGLADAVVRALTPREPRGSTVHAAPAHLPGG